MYFRDFTTLFHIFIKRGKHQAFYALVKFCNTYPQKFLVKLFTYKKIHPSSNSSSESIESLSDECEDTSPSSGSLYTSFFLPEPALSVLFRTSTFLGSGFFPSSEWSDDVLREFLRCGFLFDAVLPASLSESDPDEEDFAGKKEQKKIFKVASSISHLAIVHYDVFNLLNHIFVALKKYSPTIAVVDSLQKDGLTG